MTGFTNVCGADRVKPDGTVIAPGETVRLSAADLKNAGIASWVEAKDLIPPGDAPAPAPDLVAENETLRTQVAHLTAENETLKAAAEAATNPPDKTGGDGKGAAKDGK